MAQLRMVLAMATALILAGCAGAPQAKPGKEADVSLVWPVPPEVARVVYTQEVRAPADLGVRSSALSRFGHWLTGTGQRNDRFLKPFGISLDEEENLCLTDTGANAVCFYNRTHKKWQKWDKIGTVRFSAPVAVVKRSGIFFVADSGLGSVIAFDENGKLLNRITNHLERPSGLVIMNERLLVADSQRHKVVVFDLRGGFQGEFGRRGVGPGEFNFPTHLAADSEGNCYVTDSMNSRVQILDSTGHFKGQVGSLGDSSGSFGRPKGVAVDSFGHVYVLDAMFDNLQIFDRDGHLLLYLGETGAAKGEFWLPNGIAISRSNEIFIADSYNRRVQVFKYVGPS
jgi:sugar lactone lactonase YvrE